MPRDAGVGLEPTSWPAVNPSAVTTKTANTPGSTYAEFIPSVGRVMPTPRRHPRRPHDVAEDTTPNPVCTPDTPAAGRRHSSGSETGLITGSDSQPTRIALIDSDEWGSARGFLLGRWCRARAHVPHFRRVLTPQEHEADSYSTASRRVGQDHIGIALTGFSSR